MTAQDTSDVNAPPDDAVHHPRHYNSHASGIECVELSELLPGNLAHVCVYVWRYRSKGTPEQDLQKALWFLTRESNRTRAEQMVSRVHLARNRTRIDDRSRPLQAFEKDGDFVAVTVRALCEFDLYKAKLLIEQELNWLASETNPRR